MGRYDTCTDGQYRATGLILTPDLSLGVPLVRRYVVQQGDKFGLRPSYDTVALHVCSKLLEERASC